MNHQLKFKNMRTGDKVFDIVNYTLLTLIMLIVLYPVLYIVAASFSDPQAVVSGEVFILPVRPTLRGYEAVFKNKKILTGFANSVYYLVVGTLLNLVMTMLCAYPLSRKEFRARGGIAMFFVFTMYFSGGLVPSYILVNSLHLTNTRWAMIIPSAMSTYNMIICRTYMTNSIPDEMYEAAQIDGCTPWKYFLSIVTPLCKPILAVLTPVLRCCKMERLLYSYDLFKRRYPDASDHRHERDPDPEQDRYDSDRKRLQPGETAGYVRTSEILHDCCGLRSGYAPVSAGTEAPRKRCYDRSCQGLKNTLTDSFSRVYNELISERE